MDMEDLFCTYEDGACRIGFCEDFKRVWVFLPNLMGQQGVRTGDGAKSWDAVATRHTQLALPDAIPFAIPDRRRLQNDCKRCRRRGRKASPFYFVHTHRVLRTASRAFAMERQDPVPCRCRQGRMWGETDWLVRTQDSGAVILSTIS